MATAYEVRQVESADLGGLEELWSRLAEHHRQVEPSLAFRENHAAFWRRWLALRQGDGNTLVLAAVAPGGQAVAYLLGAVGESLPLFAPATVGYVEEVYVLPEHRGRGLFRRLLAVACDWMRAKGATRVEADVYARNAEALTAWRQAGFGPLAVRVHRDLGGQP